MAIPAKMSIQIPVVLILAISALAVVANCNVIASLPAPTAPTFSNTHSVRGVLKLPYAEIVEPFVAYLDGPNQRSRIDYYDGLSKTYQLGNASVAGTSLRVAYMTNEQVLNALTCFQVDGTDDSPVTAQSVLPDLTGFVYVGDETNGDGVVCNKFQKIDTVGEKTSTYTFWASKDGQEPVHYEMKGYNTLLGSHYDKYEVDYSDYNTTTPDASTFVVQDLKCHSFPGPGVEHVHLHNPMKEFVDNHDNHVHAAFEDFKDKHGKQYGDEVEHEMRKNVFRQNMRYVHSHNRANKGFELATNHFADFTDRELKMMRGRLHSTGYNGGLPFDMESLSVESLPDTIDWRLYGAVTPVKDQAVCGSCWAFGTVGTIEGTYFLKTGDLTSLSEQSLVDCTWGYENNGCDGGEEFRSYQWMVKHGGIPTDDSYGPYLGEDGRCHADNATKVAQLSGYVNVTSGDEDALKAAIANFGPIAVGIDAAHKEFLFYSNGVYYNADCKNGTDDLDHSVLAVGYGTLDGEPYWLIKNSWSTYWGNDGYILMSRKDNNCGVTTAATYVILPGPPSPTPKPTGKPTTPATTTKSHNAAASSSHFSHLVAFLIGTASILISYLQ